MTSKTNVIGLMSGSSLDGIDLVDADFWHDGKWHFEIIAKDNVDYDDEWRQKLADAFYYDKNQLKNILPGKIQLKSSLNGLSSKKCK